MTGRAPETAVSTVEAAVADIAAGRAVIVLDDVDRENEGDLVFAASQASEQLVGFMVRHTSGVVCVAMEGHDLDRLNLPPMTHVNEDRKQTAYTVSVDARDGVSTGISAADRAHTIRLLADPVTDATALTRPGHVFPLRAVEGGVLRRPGHTEAAVDLARLAGLPAAGVICEIVNDDGSMARLPRLRAFAREHGLTMISMAQLIRYRQRRDRLVARMVETRLPTRYGDFRLVGYRSLVDSVDHLALVKGTVEDGTDVLVRVHSECLTGDVLGSLRCDCGAQLAAGLRAIADEQRGVLLYLRAHEGRGIGLLHKLQAYQLQDDGHDTVDANLALGLPVDGRDYAVAAQMLADLGVRTIRLLTNNPGKRTDLADYGVDIADRVPMPVFATPENSHYLQTKRDRMGHELPDPVLIEVADGYRGSES